MPFGSYAFGVPYFGDGVLAGVVVEAEGAFAASYATAVAVGEAEAVLSAAGGSAALLLAVGEASDEAVAVAKAFAAALAVAESESGV